MSIITEFNNLQTKLKPLNLYSLSGNTTVDAELKAYATGLEIINEKLKVLEREAFIATALTYGLSNKESIIGVDRQGSGIDNRRNMLDYRFSITANDFSKTSIENAMIACGLDAKVIENFDGESICVNCNGLLDDFTTQEQAINSANEFLPEHLEAIFDFRTLTWDYIDNLNNSFDNMDSKNYTWNDIDNYGNIL